MNQYELTIVLPGKTTTAKKKSFQEKIEKVLSLSKGKIVKVEDWGERELSYPIRRNESGSYLHYKLELSSEAAKIVSDKIRLEEGLLRHLLVLVK